MIERISHFLIAFSYLIVFGIVRYSINQGNYHQNQILFILCGLVFLYYGCRYAKEKQVISLSPLRKKDWLMLLGLFALDILLLFVYTKFFDISSGSSASFALKKQAGLTPSLLIGLALFAPIEEELCMRGFIQKGCFQQSWVGIVLTSGLFSLLHGPADLASFGYYMIAGFLYGSSYRLSGQWLIPVLCHIGYNSFIFMLAFLL